MIYFKMINFLWKRKEYRAKFSYVVVWIIVTSESPCNKYIENLFSCCVCVCVEPSKRFPWSRFLFSTAAAAASSRLQSWPPCYSRERPRWTAQFTMGNYQQAVVPMLVPSLYISGAKALGGRLDSRATAIVAVRCSFGRNDIYSLPLSLRR